jgi:hypothetical protein
MAREIKSGMSVGPAYNAFNIVTSDSQDLAPSSARGIYVGVTGDLKVTTVQNDTVTFFNVAAGVIHPITAARVWATGTTASKLVAVY